MKQFNINNSLQYVEFYIIAGQSNCGRCRTSQMTGGESATYAGLRSNTYILNPGISTSAFSQLNVGVNSKLVDPNNSDEFGMEASLFERLVNRDNKERYLLKYGDGGTAMYNFWEADLNALGYDNLISYVQSCVDLIKAQGKKPKLVAFIWMQGENDAIVEADANAYGASLEQFFDSFKTDYRSYLTSQGIPIPSDFLTVVGRINGENDPIQVYRGTVRAAQAAFCADPANNAVLIDTDPYGDFDTVHIPASGMIQFGIDIYNSLNYGL
jgi:hypothetical protein